MVKIETELAKELKNEIERLYLLTKKINTNGNPHVTEINESKSQNGIKFIQEVDKMERPFLYYHCQIGFWMIEVRKSRKDYAIITNFECNEKRFREETTVKINKWGRYTKYEYKNTFDYTIDNYKIAIILLLEKLRSLRDNEFQW